MPDIQQQLQEVTELISLPEVYLKVRRLMDNPASDIYDFAEVISVDPNLSTRVLKVVNSAYFGCPEPVESISRAINMIGIGPLHLPPVYQQVAAFHLEPERAEEQFRPAVDVIQGYLLSKPAEAKALEAMIRDPQQHLGSPDNVVQLRP